MMKRKITGRKTPVSPEHVQKMQESLEGKRGSKPGEPHYKVTQTMRDTIQEVWNRMQVGTNAAGVETNLYFTASENPIWFYEWCKPMLPKTLFVEGENTNNVFLGLTIEQLIEIAKAGGTGSGDESGED